MSAGVAAPASADTRDDLQAARSQLDAARAEFNDLAAEWQRAEAELARSKDKADRLAAEVQRLDAAYREAQRRFSRRVVQMYMAGGSPTVTVFLTSDSIADAIDRWEFAATLAQGDQDLANEVAVQGVLLRREQAKLATAIKEQAAAAARLQARQAAAADRVDAVAGRVAELEDRVAELEAAAAARAGGAVPVTGSGAIQTCPVAGPNSFVDSFGDPRSGGRTHQGIDMIAAYGTPVVAVHAGTARQTSSTLGGLGTVVYHEGSSDWTFYTHFSSYGAAGPVRAGTVIGYVGATGDTSVNHLHFEYHPGGGAAIDPYSMLLAVC